MNYDNVVRCAFGYIEDVKIQDNNWSVKVSVWPIPDSQAEDAEPPRYGGQQYPDTNSDDDGNGRWISLEDEPSDIALKHSSNIKNKFVRILYIGDHPWHGWAKIIKEPGSESNNVLNSPERGIMRAAAAITII